MTDTPAKVRGAELAAGFRALNQIDPTAAWMIIKGERNAAGDIVRVYPGADFGPPSAIAAILERALYVVENGAPTHPEREDERN